MSCQGLGLEVPVPPGGGDGVRVRGGPHACARGRQALESPVLMVALTCSEDGFSPVSFSPPAGASDASPPPPPPGHPGVHGGC